MTRPASTGSSLCSNKLAVIGVVAAALALRPALARACAGIELSVVDDTTFDPHVLGDPAMAGLFYDPHMEGFGGVCDGDCARRELLADWVPYLAGLDATEWSRVLFETDLPTLDGLIFFLQGKQPAPAGWEHGSLATLPREARDKVVHALFLVGFARRVEPFGAVPDWQTALEGAQAIWAKREAQAADAEALQKNGEKSFAAARDPFLRQRYAFLLLRLRFYRQDWPGVVALYKAQASVLEGSSASLRWRARYYLAGAHWRLKQYAEANLELARVAAAAPGLAGSAAADFHPMEEDDWQQTLALAKTKQEKAWLWALVGLTKDGTAVMPEIAKLDPSSHWLPLLAVREVNRLEGRPAELASLESVCLALTARKDVDRPWVFDAVAGHVAALRGDFATARSRLERAVQRAPADDALLRAQARASLALALAHGWRPGDAKASDELAALSDGGVAEGESQTVTAWGTVRKKLAGACESAGLSEDAELFTPTPSWGPRKAAWSEPKFVEALIRRVSTPGTPFERFMVKGSGYTPEGLKVELARLHLVRGEYAAASQVLSPDPGTPPLHTDPFAMHVVDCHDCDHEKYASAPWTLGNYVDRLAALEREAKGQGDAAAKAAFELGSGLYNLSWHGNARVVLEDSHQAYPDTTAAERWFKRAWELARSPELKARAATMAAKCELAQDAAATTSKRWYPALRSLEGTKYEQEVLEECGWYRDWKKTKTPRAP